MKYDKAYFDQPFDRRGTACIKWDDLEAREGREMNPMWVADMDFIAPDEITQAMVRRAAHPAYGYTSQTQSATDALLAFMERRHGVKLTKEQHVLMPCVVTGLRAAVRAFTKPGDKVLILTPVYGPFYMAITQNDRLTAECPLLRDEKGYYTMDLEAIENACREGVKLMLMCNPHNPVGRAWSREELEALIAILKRYDVTLVSDEIHEDFVFEKGVFHPILSLLTSPEDKVAALTSASKTFNLAGLSQAVAFSRNPEILSAMDFQMTKAGVVRSNIFGMIATEAAYTYGDEWLDGMLAYIREGDQILREEMARLLPEAVITPLEATYLAWVNMSAYGFTSEELVERCRKEGVEFNAGTIFGKETGAGFLRVNLACQHDRIRQAVAQLAKAVLG